MGTKGLSAAYVAAIAAAMLGCATAAPPTNNPQLNQLLAEYRAHGSAKAQLGGYVRMVRAGQNFFEPLDLPAYQDLNVRRVLVAHVDTHDRGALEKAGFHVAQIGETGTTGKAETNHEFSIVVLQLDLVPLGKQLRTLIDKDPTILDDVSSKDARIVTSVAVTTRSKTEVDLAGGGFLGLKLTTHGNTVSLGIESTAGHRSTVDLDGDTVVAYQLSRFCWDRGSGRLVTFRLDQRRIDGCPGGTFTKRRPPRPKRDGSGA